jgi:tripartite-type tricarboxylate transporter receptor subunit TctC
MPMLSRRDFVSRGLLAGAASAALARAAAAQLAGNAFIISGFPAGGMGDLVSRPLADRMRGRYATNVLVESKVGAGGRIAISYVKRSPPDGLAILQIPSSAMTLYPHIYKDIGYDPLRDFVPVTPTATYVYSFTASSALPASVRTVADFIGWARANPDKSSYGIPAAGSALHFAGMMLQRAAGIEFTAVSYRGGAPLLTDMLAGVLPVSFNVLGEVLPHIKSNTLRCLGICGPERSRFLPDVPTMAEQGISEIALTEWLGWFLPAATPPEIVRNLNGMVRDGLQDPQMIASLANSALEPRYATPEQCADLLKEDHERWASIAKSTGFTMKE